MKKGLYSTFDLGISSALATLKYELVRLDKSNPKKVKFTFKRTRELEKAVSEYWNNTLELPAQLLINNQKVLKNRIYSDA